MTNKIITQEELNDYLKYEDGFLYWKKVNSNAIKVGNIAGCFQKNGYQILMLNKKFYLVHRLVFLMFNGYMPKIIDHIDGNPSNNKIENLREATQSQNLCNKIKQTNNKCGVKGVFWDSRRNEWTASCQYKGKTIRKYCKSIDEAEEVVRKLREQLHGQFAHH